MMKKYLSLLLCAALVLALCACGASASADGGSVYWLNFKPESDEVLQKVAALYTEKTGVEVKKNAQQH